MQELAGGCSYSSALAAAPCEGQHGRRSHCDSPQGLRPRSPWMTRLPDVLGRGVAGERDGWRAAEGAARRLDVTEITREFEAALLLISRSL